MSNRVRKERERAEREELILAHARRILLRDGYQSLNLDELAKAIDYSKGVIYLHFETKEDLALAVATRTCRERVAFSERGAKFQGSTRERIRAIGVACWQFAIEHPDYFQVELMLKSASFWEKASSKRQQEHSMECGRCFRPVLGIVEEAVKCGDLPEGLRPEHMTFGLIAVTIGSHIMLQQMEMRLLADIQDPVRILRQNQDCMLDGLGWRPFMRDHDYHATDRRIQQELFPEATWLLDGH